VGKTTVTFVHDVARQKSLNGPMFHGVFQKK